MDQDISEVIDAIIWAHRIVSVNNDRYVFRPLSLEDKNISNYIHTQATDFAKTEGRKTKHELKIEALKRGIWKASYDNDLKILKQELDSSLLEQEKLQKQSKGKRNLPSALVAINKRIDFLHKTILDIDNLFLSCIELPSIEYYAEQERAHYVVAQCTLAFPQMRRRWQSFNDFLQEQDTGLVHGLINMYYRMEIANESTIRAAARSPVWRIKWSGSKKNGGVKTLFGREMYDLTLDQFRLVYWSQIYDSAFESMEPPTDEVVADDKLFDAWLDEQAEKRKQINNKNSLEKKIKNSKNGQEIGMTVDGYYSNDCTCGAVKDKFRPHDKSCPFGVFLYYQPGNEKKQKEVEKIQAANPEHIRKLLAREQEMIAKKGVIAEQDLRRDDITRTTLGMSTKLIGPDGPRGRAR